VEDYIAPFCGFGADALMLADYSHVKNQLLKTPLRRIAPGPLSYGIAAATRSLPSYFFRKMPHCRVTNQAGDAYRVGSNGKIVGPPIPKGEVIYEGSARIASISTIPYYGFGFRVFPYAEERGDRMHLRISTIGPVRFVKNFKPIWRGTYANPEVLFDYLVESISIEMDPPTAFQIGGDVRGERSHVTATLSPQPIRLVDFYAPPSAS
jgi:hypothetical protein